jgi:hypothetical protein
VPAVFSHDRCSTHDDVAVRAHSTRRRGVGRT